MIRELEDPDRRFSRKKFRGKRRYFRNVLKEAQTFSIQPSEDRWFDLWHYHADWPGWGNLRWKYRRQHLEALAIVFRNLADEATRLQKPFQLWILLDGQDAGQDAVYLHTPNPNANGQFPAPLRNAVWGASPLLAFFERLLPGLELRVGHARSYSEFAEPPRETSTFFVYCPSIGVPLEA